MSAAAGRNALLDELRALMAAHSPPLHALVVPSDDAHQSEYVAERDKRLQFISGFTGIARSAGLALITMKEALLWTDGRYFLQAEKQLSDHWELMCMGEDPPVEVWIADNLSDEAVIGINPWCISVDTAQRYEHAFSKKHQTLFQLSSDLVDEVWKDRPLANTQPVVHPVEFAGCSVTGKLKELRKKLLHEKARGIIIAALDEVAWLYNIRGNDVHYSPVVHSYSIVTLHSAFFYVDNRKVSVENRSHDFEGHVVNCDSYLVKVQSYMSENGIDIRDYNMVQSDVSLLASGQLKGSAVNGSSHEGNGMNDNSKIVIDNSCCLALYSKLDEDQVLILQSPVALSKAVKNPVELDGLRKAHIRDGVAVVQYLAWLDNQMQENYGASGYFSGAKGSQKKEHVEVKLTEVSVSDKLEGFRAAKEYLDGTTDITRTVHFGKPSEHEKSCYTAVLKGHIALDTAVFPNGTTGHALDILARTPLWKSGLDYRHGTGHGVGSYLTVHEGPHQISFRPSARNVPLQASMTVTDEPGYYEDGSFGIRLENVLIVQDANTKFNFGDKGYLAFEHITWAPYQTKLIDATLLAPAEIEWVNTYHSDCRRILQPYLNEQEKEWLRKATEPITLGAGEEDGLDEEAEVVEDDEEEAVLAGEDAVNGGAGCVDPTADLGHQGFPLKAHSSPTTRMIISTSSRWLRAMVARGNRYGTVKFPQKVDGMAHGSTKVRLMAYK
uniref:Aminopeptidase P N-terminal domain-containing protein n=1 Tax=Oryza nivara TaxID=4536 RepID=A0A0E0J2Q5_ORYNI